MIGRLDLGDVGRDVAGRDIRTKAVACIDIQSITGGTNIIGNNGQVLIQVHGNLGGDGESGSFTSRFIQSVRDTRRGRKKQTKGAVMTKLLVPAVIAGVIGAVVAWTQWDAFVVIPKKRVAVLRAANTTPVRA